MPGAYSHQVENLPFKFWLKFWLLSGALPDISSLHWYLPTAKLLESKVTQFSTHYILPCCWGSYSQNQGLHPNILFFTCGASLNTNHQASASHGRVLGILQTTGLHTSELQDVFGADGVCCVLCPLSVCQFLFVSELESDLGLTSHSLLSTCCAL